MLNSNDPMESGNQPGDPTPGSISSRLQQLRWLAIIGTGIVFLWRLTSLWLMQPRQDWGFVVVIVAFLAVGFTCLVLMPTATARLRRHMDLLMPLGLYFIAEALLEGLAAISVVSLVLTPAWSLKILSIIFPVSLMLVLQIVIGVWFAGWTTILILQAVRQDHVDPLQGFAAVPSRFWRVLGAEALGWIVLFAVVGVAITVGVVVLPLALLVIAIFSLIWNLMTAALLPVVVAERKGFGESVREGIRISWEGKSRWWLPVVAQMILLGWVTLIVVSYTSNPQPGSFSRQDKTNFGINGFWTGGYDDECRWFSKLMEAVEAEPLPLAQFILSAVFTVLAIVVKLEITALVYPHPEIPADNPSLA